MTNKNTFTTIKLDKTTKNELNKLKLAHNENFNTLILRLIKENKALNQDKNNLIKLINKS